MENITITTGAMTSRAAVAVCSLPAALTGPVGGHRLAPASLHVTPLVTGDLRDRFDGSDAGVAYTTTGGSLSLRAPI